MAVSKTDLDIFSKSGPFHITSIDWNDSSHRTAVIASLVNGVYVLQRLGPNAGAEPWWESFNFTMLETLVNKKDNSIYGAIFQNRDTHNLEISPRYVIAFRGTILRWKTWRADTILDIAIAFDILHRSSRVAHAVEKVRTMVDKGVWLAGHSLGAGIALLVGKTMIRKFGISLETYAFNPPISAIPLNEITDNETLKIVCRLGWGFFKFTLHGSHPEENQEDDAKIASWIPHLYVNSADLICSEYLGYFSNKKRMSVIGASKIETVAAKTTFRSFLTGRRGEGTSSPSTERLHILPSANMIINVMDKSTKFKVAHGLHQWWEKNADESWKIKDIRPTMNIKND